MTRLDMANREVQVGLVKIDVALRLPRSSRDDSRDGGPRAWNSRQGSPHLLEMVGARGLEPTHRRHLC
jgi:hypothetical protein